MPVFPSLRSALPTDVSVSTSKLISVIKPYRKVTVSFLVLQTEDLAVVFLCRCNLAGNIGSTMISYLADGNWKSSSETTVLSAAFSECSLQQSSVTWVSNTSPSHTKPASTTFGRLDLYEIFLPCNMWIRVYLSAWWYKVLLLLHHYQEFYSAFGLFKEDSLVKLQIAQLIAV